MAKTDNLTDFLTDIADTIRAKKGTTALINPQDFSSEIASIETGGGVFEKYYVKQIINGNECELELTSTNQSGSDEKLVGQLVVDDNCKLYLIGE